HNGALGGQIAVRIVNFLFGNAVRLEEFGVADGRDFGEVYVGLRGGQISARLGKLLVNFGGIDVREEFALAHPAANVVVPHSQVAIGARVDGRFDVGHQRAGEHQIFIAALCRGMEDGHGGNGGGFGVVGKRFVRRAALEHLESANGHKNNGDEEEN